MLGQSLAYPKKWAWLLEEDNDDNGNPKGLSMETMIGIMGMSPHLESQDSTLFGHSKPKKKKKKKKMTRKQMMKYYLDNTDPPDPPAPPPQQQQQNANAGIVQQNANAGIVQQNANAGAGLVQQAAQ